MRSAVAAATPAASSPPNISILSSAFCRYGFSAAQTERIMRKSPWFLTAEPEKTIEPKLDFFLNYGYSHGQLG
ncbi:hypothetical protein FCM35_KLT08573 [Carex littledalei]|uniref:Uncharacterized protein n=1 Tax=Carex littledalei TaxID=544730 RepID=A0A833QQ84_9POAL|nr:hypothetical protein FCM35_KLT08573 [Carex littledalei]